MRSFRDFFNEATAASMNRLPFRGGTQHSGYFDLPDLQNFYEPGQRPAGGFQNFSQVTQAYIDRHRYGGSDDYILRDTLEKIRALVENVYSAILLRKQQQKYGTPPPSKAYEKDYVNASYDPQAQIVHGISKHEMIGGNYPRLRNEEMARAEHLGVIFPDPQDPSQFWAVSVPKLREAMEELQNRLWHQERAYRAQSFLAGKADQAFDNALQPTSVQRFKSVDPSQ